MKKLTTTIFFLFAITIVVAQPSLKGKMMPDSNAVWVYNCADWFNPPSQPPNQFRNWFSVENSDTLINTTFYHKFFGNFGSSKFYIGAYRNDTSSRIVYVVPKDSTSEYIWMDFSLNIGDTIYSVFTINQKTYSFAYIDFEITQNIDTHQTLGSKEIEMRAYNWPFDHIFTEGVGLSNSRYGLDFGCDLQCFIHNGYYYLGQQGKCLNVGIEEQNTQLKIELFPNPVTSISTLSIDKIGEVKSISIYDIFGRKVKEYHPANTIEINSTELKSGIYVYSVKTSQKNYSGRFLVQ